MNENPVNVGGSFSHMDNNIILILSHRRRQETSKVVLRCVFGTSEKWMGLRKYYRLSKL